jgi:hypothetical protein
MNESVFGAAVNPITHYAYKIYSLFKTSGPVTSPSILNIYYPYSSVSTRYSPLDLNRPKLN